MQDVATGQLLGPVSLELASIRIPRAHFLAADNARVFSSQLFGGGVGISVHVSESLFVLQKSCQSLEEAPCRHEKVSHDVDRESVE